MTILILKFIIGLYIFFELMLMMMLGLFEKVWILLPGTRTFIGKLNIRYMRWVWLAKITLRDWYVWDETVEIQNPTTHFTHAPVKFRQCRITGLKQIRTNNIVGWRDYK